MPLSHREHFLRNASFQGHEYIPQDVYISGRYWAEYREGVEEVLARHRVLFPNFEKGKTDFDGFGRAPDERVVTDGWGCTWDYELDGLDGQVIGHPLDDWSKMDGWKPPAVPTVTEMDLQNVRDARARGGLTAVGSEHGFLFLRLGYLRGWDNLLADMGAGEPKLDELIEIVCSHWEAYFRPYIAEGLDVLNLADDLGMQTSSIMGPKHFRRYLLPAYQRIMLPAKRSGAHVSMHHDGYIMDIMDEIIESGCTIVNPQDLLNGIDALAREVKGRVCIHLDIDRQSVVPFGSPKDIRELIREEVVKLGSPQGGLMMVVGVYPPTPLENLDALLGAMEEHRTYWVGK